jgi:hypothetical protein
VRSGAGDNPGTLMFVAEWPRVKLVEIGVEAQYPLEDSWRSRNSLSIQDSRHVKPRARAAVAC